MTRERIDEAEDWRKTEWINEAEAWGKALDKVSPTKSIESASSAGKRYYRETTSPNRSGDRPRQKQRIPIRKGGLEGAIKSEGNVARDGIKHVECKQVMKNGKRRGSREDPASKEVGADNQKDME